MPDSRSARLARLREQSERDRFDAERSMRAELQNLVDLLYEIQPLRRVKAWPVEVVLYLAARQNSTCPACGDAFALHTGEHHVDHVIPWSLGGGNETANIQILHARCNLSKGAQADVDDLIVYLQGRIRNI